MKNNENFNIISLPGNSRVLKSNQSNKDFVKSQSNVETPKTVIKPFKQETKHVNKYNNQLSNKTTKIQEYSEIKTNSIKISEKLFEQKLFFKPQITRSISSSRLKTRKIKNSNNQNLSNFGVYNNSPHANIYSPKPKFNKKIKSNNIASPQLESESFRQKLSNIPKSINDTIQSSSRNFHFKIDLNAISNKSSIQTNFSLNNKFNESNLIKPVQNQNGTISYNSILNNKNVNNNYYSLETKTNDTYDYETNLTYDTTTFRSKNSKNIVNNNNIEENNAFNYYVNIEDLILLEEKLIIIQEALQNNSRIIANSCFDWWNFSNFCSIGGKFEFYFKDLNCKSIIRETNVLELITIILCYELSFNIKFFEILQENLINLLNLVHQNLLLICDYLISKVSSESLDNLWVKKLSIIIQNKSRNSFLKGDNIICLKKNNEYLKKIIKSVFELFNEGQLMASIFPYVNNFKVLTIAKLNEIFRKKSLRIYNKNASIPAAVLLDNEEKLNSVEGKFLVAKTSKKYSLVLDLDETLIHFQVSNSDKNKGVLNLRPGIYYFLNVVSIYYDLMIFTAGTSDYADPIIDAIERDKWYFSHRFYRQHTSIINNDFIKDISRLGRDLSKIIIVDNMPQNFRLQTENGIFIKTFYGEDTNDTALIELALILKKIAESNIRDVRISLFKFKDEIMKKVSSNIYKNF